MLVAWNIELGSRTLLTMPLKAATGISLLSQVGNCHFREGS